ncbi:MAG: hypothetical protein JWP28_666 [Phenylobacterium sp.]|uniref:hypothetical protein n=1 Tax=Phenylobacterium sp. TaxID=1871053 RepID=UPI002619FA45|nr:hypothetical protein [Phenylobacterium sp.]MDB5496635.1 hypothetical protein [Phenylobacterium sp.]
MRTLSKALTVILLLGAASPVAAAVQKAPAPGGAAGLTTGVTGDVRCLLTMGALASNKANQQAATLGVYFFEGRITARAPTLDLTAALKTEVARMGPADLQSEAQRCGSLVRQAAQALQAAQASFSGPVSTPGAAPATPAPTPAPVPKTPTPTPK